MDVRVGLWRKLSAEELMLLNCGVGEDPWESLELQGDPTSHSKGDQSCVFIGRTDAKAATPILWPPHAKSWLIGKDLDAGRDWEQEEKGTTKLTQWTWVWVNSGSWWWTGRLHVLWFMGSQRVRYDWVTQLNWFLPRKPPSHYCLLLGSVSCGLGVVTSSLIVARTHHTVPCSFIIFHLHFCK